MRRVLAALILVVCLAVVGATLTRPSKETTGPHARPLLPRASLVRTAGKAFLPLVTDYYWLGAIQATGKASLAAEYLDVYDYAQLVTDLDPDFAYVYQFAGVLVPTNLGREHWVNTAESTSILEKGVARFPKAFFLHVLLAYNYSFFDRDYLRSARLLEETAKFPGAPTWISLLATRLYAQSGAFEAASAFANQLALSADPETRATFERRQKEIALERILTELDAAVAGFREKAGRLPRDLGELKSAGLIAKLPEDPLGGQIGISDNGRTYSSSETHRLEVYDPRSTYK